jgi:uncharacterized protein YcbX
MALIVPEFDRSGTAMLLNAPGMPEISVPLDVPTGSEPMDVMVWNIDCIGQEVSKEASAWLSRFLDLSDGCKLVKIADDFQRTTDPKISKNNGQTGFADSFPFLLATTASLEEFNKSLTSSIGMENFRPNIVVKGCENAYSEDKWTSVIFNNALAIDVAQPCSRCKMPNNNQSTGVMDEEAPVSKMLEKHRSGSVLNFKDKSATFFGIHLDNPAHLGPLTGSSISVGHPVKAFF